MLERLKQFIKKLRQINVIFVAGILLSIVVIILFVTSIKNNEQNQTQTPTLNKLPEVIINKPKLKILSITPPSGTQKTFDRAEYIKIQFSEPISTLNIKLTVEPKIRLKTIVPANSKDLLVITPDNEFWKPRIHYKITISGITSENSKEALEQIIKYDYFNVPVDNIEVGD